MSDAEIFVYGAAFERHVRSVENLPPSTLTVSGHCADRNVLYGDLTHKTAVCNGGDFGVHPVYQQTSTIVPWTPGEDLPAAVAAHEAEVSAERARFPKGIRDYMFCIVKDPTEPRAPFRKTVGKVIVTGIMYAPDVTDPNGSTRAMAKALNIGDSCFCDQAPTLRRAQAQRAVAKAFFKTDPSRTVVDTDWTLTDSDYRALTGQVVLGSPRIILDVPNTGPSQAEVETKEAERKAVAEAYAKKKATETATQKAEQEKASAEAAAQRKKELAHTAELKERDRRCRAGDKSECGVKKGARIGATKQ